jgi:DNA-directed RNA polymerase specialized sigma24 family protein
LTHPFSLEDEEANAELLEEIDWETTGLRDLAYRVQTDIGLKRALNGISPKQRLAVILKFFYSASESEMGHVMGCSSGTARTYLRSGMLTAAKLFNTSEGNEHAAV